MTFFFVELAKKELSPEHARIMGELEEEHRVARKTVGELVSATEKWSEGDKSTLGTIRDRLRSLCELYPKHIEKEDKQFFMPCQNNFSKEERVGLLNQGYEFDKKFTNVVYGERMKTLLDHR